MSFDITYIFSATCCLQRKTYSEERSEQRKRGNEIYELETETLQTRKKYLFLVTKEEMIEFLAFCPEPSFWPASISWWVPFTSTTTKD